mmetsp:Transcript_20341/g.31004  ORF Transcript_20341/g.31004 Transcript_20341/m.31004 type:complete len:191 (-) Transcript_20341:380-952(-)
MSWKNSLHNQTTMTKVKSIMLAAILTSLSAETNNHLHEETRHHENHFDASTLSNTNPIEHDQAAEHMIDMCQGSNKCTECIYDSSGNPIPSYYCSDYYPCPATVCCGAEEDTCYDENSTAFSCARLGSVGCPCPENEMRCGNSTYSFGWCDAICCDPAIEQVCTDEEGNPSCAPYGDCTQTSHANLRAQA